MTAPLEFEPGQALGALLMALRGVRLDNPAVEQACAELVNASKGARPSDVAAWVPVYRGAIELVPRVLEAHEAIGRRRANDEQQAANKQRAAQAAQAAQGALTRAANDWAQRIKEQLDGPDGLLAKATRSVEKLEVTATDDAATGQTEYHVDPSQLDGFWRWLSSVEARWAENNGRLTAVRANEALAADGVVSTRELPIEVSEVDLTGASSEIKLKGHATPTQGALHLVSNTFKTATAIFSSVGGLSFVLPRIVGASAGVTMALSVFSGVVLLGAFGFAAVSVPQKVRQARELLRRRAAEEVHRELTTAVDKRLQKVGEHQLARIRKHLGAEANRIRALGGTPSLAPPPMPALQVGGLMPRDADKLRSEWPQALRARLAELEARAK